MSILIIAEHDGKVLSNGTLCTLDAAVKIGGEINLLVTGKSAKYIAENASKLKAVNKVLLNEDEIYNDFIAEEMASLIIKNSADYSYILASGSTFGKNIMPRVAALLDTQMLSEISKVIDKDTFERPIYAGNAIATVKSNDKVKVLTVRSTAFDKLDEKGGNANIENIESGEVFAKTKFISHKLSDSEKPQLTNANIVVSGGRGMKEAKNFSMLEELAEKLGGGAIGASRAAVDVGWVPNDYQVGQTGKIVAPDLYIAVGISGAIQHLAGMKDSKIIVAINKDENAPIFEVASYGLVADLFEAVPELIEQLEG